ncbi:MAG: hypothetical protein ACXVSF_18880 [Solirubrobacteraceae bacterium]
MVALSGCGGSSGSARAVLTQYLAAWNRGDWAAMRSLVVEPPPSFTSTNAQAFHALGVTRASFVPVRVTPAQSGTAALARVREHFALRGREIDLPCGP